MSGQTLRRSSRGEGGHGSTAEFVVGIAQEYRPATRVVRIMGPFEGGVKKIVDKAGVFAMFDR